MKITKIFNNLTIHHKYNNILHSKNIVYTSCWSQQLINKVQALIYINMYQINLQIFTSNS